ncbi:MAG: hypothetical protein ABEI57_04325 [Halapricum sp.]
MDRSSRRGFLAAMGSAVFAGCSTLDGRDRPETLTPYELAHITGSRSETARPFVGPQPLGRAAVPADAGEPPSFERERIYESAARQYATGVVQRGDGLGVLLAVWGHYGARPPVLLEADASGLEQSHSELPSPPSNRVWWLGRMGEQLTVCGADGRGGARMSWVQGYRDRTESFEYTTMSGTVFSSAVTVADSIVIAGRNMHRIGLNETSDAVCVRLGADGQQAWKAVESSAVHQRYWAVTTTSNGILAGGASDGSPFVVAYTLDGRERWQRTIPRGGQSYAIRAITNGPTGTYAVARTSQYGAGDNHLLLLSLDDDGIAWARVFDPNTLGSRDSPDELAVAGVHDDSGPVIVGTTSNRAWLAATDPDGSMRWAGYCPSLEADSPTYRDPAGTTTIDGRIVVYGNAVDRESERPTPNGWLAWL